MDALAALPIHPKRRVAQVSQAAVQGAWIDREQGTMCAKPTKIVTYMYNLPCTVGAEAWKG